MSIRSFLVIFIFCFLPFSKSFAQDLIQKVPAEVNFLATVNNKAIFKHLSMPDVDGFFTNLGLFKNLSERGVSIQKLEDFGVDFTAKAYFYVQTTDSVQYFGGLVPLADVRLFENLLGKDQIFETVNGLRTIYSKDRTMRVSWDSNTVYLLGGVPTKSYFKQEEIRIRYDLPKDPYAINYNDYDPYSAETDSVTGVTGYPDYLEASSAEMSPHARADAAYPMDTIITDIYQGLDTGTVSGFPPPASPLPSWEDEYRGVDSILSQDTYQDDYYKKSRTYEATLDSALHVLISSWVDERIAQIIGGNIKGYSSNKGFAKLSDNTILDFRVQHLDAIFSSVDYPMDVLYAGMGISRKPKIDHGIEEIAGQVVVDANKLILQGEVGLDKEMTRYYKEIYAKKINPKFLRYLDRETLGFMSFNVHTEAYLKYFPRIMDRYYGNLGIRHNDFVGLGTLLFDVFLDEKAIAKVFKGDNLMVVNGFDEVEVTYTDYEYDDNFQYNTIEKTKKETVPQFLWMFSSDDFRIFDKLIEIGIQKEKVKAIGGIYELKKGARDVLQLYVLMKDGMVFLGNDLEKLLSINSNHYYGRGHRPYMDMARRNSFSVLFNTSRFTDFVDHLDLPVGHSTRQLVDEMKYYGDFYMISPGMNKNKLRGQIGLEFPAQKGNALSFLFGLVERWATDLKYNMR